MILLFGGEKGGTGKTTLAVQMAAYRAASGRDVLLVDADRQGSAMRWTALRVKNQVQPAITCVALYGETLSDQINSMVPRFDDIVVDTRGADAVELRSAMIVADRLITPSRTSQFDIFTLGTVNNLIQQARGFNRKLDACILINCAPTHATSREADEMREAVSELPAYRILSSIVKDRKAFRTVGATGQAVFENGTIQDEKACFEFNMLAKEAWADLPAR